MLVHSSSDYINRKTNEIKNSSVVIYQLLAIGRVSIHNTTFVEINFFSVVRIDRRKDMKTLIISFRKYVNTSKSVHMSSSLRLRLRIK